MEDSTTRQSQGSNWCWLILSIYKPYSLKYGVQICKIYFAASGIITLSKGYIYQRLGNPTTQTAETIINELEGGHGCLMFTSGLAAMSSVFLCFLKAGDHIVCQIPCYSGSMQFVKNTLQKFGVQVDWAQADCVEDFEKLIKPNTKLLYGETPCNPNMAILDLEAFGKLGQRFPGLLTVIDSTFGSPYLQQPLKFGYYFSSCKNFPAALEHMSLKKRPFKMLLHALYRWMQRPFCFRNSKYLGGHSDIIGGCCTVNDIKLWKQLKWFQSTNGSAHAPFDSYLLIRGLKTLALRMERCSATALALAKFLEEHPKVKKVHYPGLKSHPNYEVAKRQMKAFSGMISFEMENLESAKHVVENVKLINLAVSLGGTESLIEHPASMTHGPMITSQTDRDISGITDGLIRFSVGLEDVEDLKADLTRALEKA